MQALFNIEPSVGQGSRQKSPLWTHEQRREVLETVFFWLEFPEEDEVSVDFLRNGAIRIQFDRLPELHWTEKTFERFGTMLAKHGVRRVWFG
ncbi:MAG: hypothetical protein Q7S98_01860 [Deltaproteobacteria bacterium]|nr:hypothetical protein [Deltaproteobacteria bacterium]